MNFTRDDYETILYSLEGYIQGNDDEELCDKLVDICYRIERKLSDIECISNNKSNVTYNEVDYVEQCITEGHDYRDCVDTLVDRMKSTK